MCAAVIPAYNERATIRSVAARAASQAHMVIVIDDGSTDGTAEALEGLPVVLLRNERNAGKGCSLWKGMQHALAAGATCIITLDGDGQHAPEDIPRLMGVARSHPGDIIVGARLIARHRSPSCRRWANRFADFWIGWAAGQALADSQSGFRVYPSPLVRSLEIRHDPSRGFVFESELLIAAASRGVSIRSVAIAATAPHDARPSHFRPVSDIARIARMVAWQLVRRGLYPSGLCKSLFTRAARRESLPARRSSVEPEPETSARS